MAYLPFTRRLFTSCRQRKNSTVSPASLLITRVVRSWRSPAAEHRVVPSYSCYRRVDLSYDRDSGTGDYAIELPLFRRSITPRALTWKSLQQPSSRASTLLTGYFPHL